MYAKNKIDAHNMILVNEKIRTRPDTIIMKKIEIG
jgi:hypothetical protein